MLTAPRGPACSGCVLSRSGRGFLKVTGTGSNGVMLVGESLDYSESKSGEPLTGRASFVFNKILKRFVKEPRENFSLANTTFCTPPGSSLQGKGFKYAAIQQCSPHLDAAIEKAQPRAIVAMGDVAMERFIGRSGVLKRQNYAYWAEAYNAWVVPAVSPGFIMQGAHKYQPILAHAIRKAMRIAQEGYAHDAPKTIHHPTASEFENFIRRYYQALALDPTLVLAFDIETNYKGAKDESKLKEDSDPTYEILQISFAFSGEEGIALEWNEGLKPLISHLFASPGTKCVWNQNYDVPRILANGVAINGTIRDSMMAWHCLNSDQDKSLSYVTPLVPGNHGFPYWKDQNSEDGGWYYSAMDSVALWRNDAGIMQSLEAQGILPFYLNYVEGIRDVLDDMESSGMLVDTTRQGEFIVRMEQELGVLDDKMQTMVPEELRDLNPPEGYKREPEDTTGMRRISVPNQTWKVCPVCQKKNPTKPHFKTFVAKKSLHKNTPCSGASPLTMKGDEQRWATVLPFKPSPKQLLRYAESKGYPLKKNWKTDNFTMDEETLLSLSKRRKQEQLFPTVLQHRSLQKLYGLYGPDGLLIGSDGRVHTHFSDNPSTLRFASYGPNMQNIPRGNPADANDPVNLIRSFFVARPGWCLGARDFTGIEAVLVGYLAGDRDYVRLAKMGVHDYFNAHIAVRLGQLKESELPDLSWSDEDLRACLAGLKKRFKQSRPVAKACVHMSNYLGSPRMMMMTSPDLFPHIVEAEIIQSLYFEVFPKIKDWQRSTCLKAEKQGFVMAPTGLPHRFYQVYEYEKDKETHQWVKKLGPDAKRCVAFNPQHLAAWIMRRSIRDMRETEARQYLRLTIHDELMWESPMDQLLRIDQLVKEIMERPNKELPLDPTWNMGEYLSVGTEGKYGPRWGEMDDLDKAVAA